MTASQDGQEVRARRPLRNPALCLRTLRPSDRDHPWDRSRSKCIPSLHATSSFVLFPSSPAGLSATQTRPYASGYAYDATEKKTKFLFIAFVFDIEPTELTDFLSRYQVGTSRHYRSGHFRLSRISPAAMKSSTASDILRYISSLHVLLYFLFFFSLHVVMVGP